MQYLRYELYHREGKTPIKAMRQWLQQHQKCSCEQLVSMFNGEIYFIADNVKLKSKDLGRVFKDPVLFLDSPPAYDFAIQVTYKNGVTDNRGHAASEALQLLGVKTHVRSGRIYFLCGDISRDILVKAAYELLANQLLEECQVFTRQEFEALPKQIEIQDVPLRELGPDMVEQINLEMGQVELLALSSKNCWALDNSEIKIIRRQFLDANYQGHRRQVGLGPNPTDVEMEIIAQTWSEHCKHKIFSAQIEYNEGPLALHRLGAHTVDGAFKTFIKKTSEQIIADRKIDWAVSLFKDNAGIVRFDKNIDLCAKVETHNSPSALDPYGGALTGILGVNRDILGTGQGARPILNTDVFCVAHEKDEGENVGNYSDAINVSELPKGLLSPRRILEGVHKGVEDGGNKSGIPTIAGSIYFNSSYAGKPLVYVGTVGVLPPMIKGKPTAKKEIHAGDLIVMAGGRIGRDGVHGATMSSLELEESIPLSVVQIGDPITQKRLQDFLLEARDLGLYRTLTDNGAGGLSSSVGELAQLSGGAEIDVTKCPVKYPGLMPWEIVVSESQERMTFAVPAENWSEFYELSQRRGVEASVLGTFNSSGYFDVKIGKVTVASLPLEFLHHGLPAMELKAYWNGADAIAPFFAWRKNKVIKPKTPEYKRALQILLARPNIASKWPWITQYDHEVQAATVVRPMGGASGEAPNNAGGVWLYPHGGERENGVLVSMGLSPRLSLVDPYLMSICAVDEALRNAVAHGGDPAFTAILDNFCWPDPLVFARNTGESNPGDQKLGMLVRALNGLRDAALALGLPMISGKDSMKNDFKGKRGNEEITISALPTLLVTAISRFNVTRTISSAIQGVGQQLYLIGDLKGDLAGSEYAEIFDVNENDFSLNLWNDLKRLPEMRKVYETIHQGISDKIILSAHDLSEGGLAVALSEMLLHSNNLGFECSLPVPPTPQILFGEGPFRMVVAISREKEDEFKLRFAGMPVHLLGRTNDSHELTFTNQGTTHLSISAFEIREAWHQKLNHEEKKTKAGEE